MFHSLAALFLLSDLAAKGLAAPAALQATDFTKFPKSVLTERSHKPHVYQGFPYILGQNRPMRWTLETMPPNYLFAVNGGPGDIRVIGVFCFSDVPYLAMNFDIQRVRAEFEFDFEFSKSRFERIAYHEPLLADAYIISLQGSALPGLLTDDKSVSIRFDGVSEGALPLAGAKGAIRTVLSICQRT